MRVGYGFLAAGLIFSSSIAMTARHQQLAEEQFKNIKSFKGQKASTVIPAMQFMSASLKVSCDYCHTQDRASDEKEPKNTAREMIEMQNDINSRHFGGRVQVTCATCHAGHTRPIAFPPTEGIETRTRRTTDVTPDQILAAYTKVSGDASKIQSLSLQGISEEKTGKQKIEEIRNGDKFYMVVHGAKSDLKKGFNGTDAWFRNGAQSITIPSQFSSQFLNQEVLPLGSVPKLTSPTAGTAKIGDKDMIVLSGGLEGSESRASIFFDKLTGLPARITYTYPSILGRMAQINDFADYRKVEGVMVPMKVEHHSAEEDTTVHVNPKINPTMFDPAK
jgi:hypothetical protein